MSQTLKLSNYLALNIVEQTELDADTAIGVTNFTVKNTNNFSADDYFIIGTLGAETCEKLVISSVTDTTHFVSSTTAVREHKRFEPITLLFGNQIKVYRAANTDGTTPADDDFTVLATVDIDFDQVQTEYTDATGSSDYWYKFVYYNEASTQATSLADIAAVRGGGVGDYCTLEDVKREAGMLNNRYVTDDQVDEKRQSAQRMIDSYLSGVYTVPFSEPINALIKTIAIRLAAGNLLLSVYGQTTNAIPTNGQAKVDAAMVDLAKLKSGEWKILDEVGTDTSLAGATAGVNSYPNVNTENTQTGEEGPLFRITDRY